MKRDEIAELADDARVASNAYPDMEMKVPAPMLAELCRVWLAVDVAPAVDPGTITLAKPVKLLAIPEDDTHAHD